MASCRVLAALRRTQALDSILADGPPITAVKSLGGSAKLEWANSHRLRNIDELKQVKANEGSDIVLWGSSTLYPQLLDANLIDRLLLMTMPIVLGKGKRIFGNTSHQAALKLTKCEATPTGVIIAAYEATPGG
jgi:dihydrofolate reductase